MTIRPMALSDIETVAAIHAEIIPSLSSRLGAGYLKKMYRLLLSQPHLHICFVAEEKHSIIGSITVTRNFHVTQKLMGNIVSIPVIVGIGKQLLQGKVTILELWRRLQFELSVRTKFPAPYVTILTLFVIPARQKRGIGKKLVEKIIEALGEKTHCLYVDTIATNRKAQSFYQHAGFQETARISDSIVYRKEW